MQTSGETLRQTLRVRDAVAMTIGIVVGAGIFRAPASVAGAAGDGTVMILAWVAGGLISLIGALCYAELASAFPHPGGDYHYLTRAFGRRLSFLYAWARLTVIQTGSVAVLAYVFGDYASALFRLGENSSAIYAAAAVVAITAVQWVGVRAGVRAQNWLTTLEVVGLVAVIVAGLAIAPQAAPAVAAGAASTPAYGLILVFVLLTFGGWNEAVYISAELKDARRRMAPVLVLSLLAITVLYVLANLAYLRALGLSGVAGSKVVAADVMQLAFGPVGATLISAFVAVAALTSANATVFTGARTAYALGRDHPQLAILGRWHGKAETPRNGILLQGGASLLVVAIGAFTRDGFETAVGYTAGAFWFFFLLVGVSLFVLRWKEPDAERPFRVPFYPLTPALFCATNAYLLWSTLTYTAGQDVTAGALAGAVVLGLGLILLIPLRSPNKETTP